MMWSRVGVSADGGGVWQTIFHIFASHRLHTNFFVSHFPGIVIHKLFVSRKNSVKKHYLIMSINFGNIMIAGRLPLPSREVIIMCCSVKSFKIRTALAFGMPERLVKSAVLKIGASKIVSSA